MENDDNIYEAFKWRDQLDYVQQMNSIRNRTGEMVLSNIIYN